MKTKVFNYCQNELKNYPELYLDKITNEINTALMAESFINENNIDSEDEEDVFDFVLEWWFQYQFKPYIV
jgi:protocatechuate 3,4-dioxygenase beta subunit